MTTVFTPNERLNRQRAAAARARIKKAQRAGRSPSERDLLIAQYKEPPVTG